MPDPISFLKELFSGVSEAISPPPHKAASYEDTYAKTVMRPFGLDGTLTKLPKEIYGYRADPTGKFGGKEGIETLPTKFDNYSTADMYANTRAMRKEKALGIPQLSAKELAAFILKEGRGDMHLNSIDENNPEVMKLYSTLSRKYPKQTAAYLVALKEKSDIAKRLGITFAEAWNGTGKARGTNQTGAQYAKGYEHFLKAASHPKNANLVQYLQSAINAED